MHNLREIDRQTDADLYTPTLRKWETEKDTLGTLGSVFTPPLPRHSALPYFIKCVGMKEWAALRQGFLFSDACLCSSGQLFASDGLLSDLQRRHGLFNMCTTWNAQSTFTSQSWNETVLNNKELNKRVSDELNGGGSGQRNIPVLQLMTRSDPTVMEIFGTCGVF